MRHERASAVGLTLGVLLSAGTARGDQTSPPVDVLPPIFSTTTPTCLNAGTPCTLIPSIAAQTSAVYSGFQWAIYGAAPVAPPTTGTVTLNLAVKGWTSRGIHGPSHQCSLPPETCSVTLSPSGGTHSATLQPISTSTSLDYWTSATATCSETVALGKVDSVALSGFSGRWYLSASSHSNISVERQSGTWDSEMSVTGSRGTDVVEYAVLPPADPKGTVTFSVLDTAGSSGFLCVTGGTSTRSTRERTVCDSDCHEDVDPVMGTSPGTSQFLYVRYGVETDTSVSVAFVGLVRAGGGSVTAGGFVIDNPSVLQNTWQAVMCPDMVRTAQILEQGAVQSASLGGTTIDLGRPTRITLTRNAYASYGPGSPGFGDVSGDGRCGFADRTQLVALVRGGQVVGFDDPDYQPGLDLDMDGDNDGDDLTVFDAGSTSGCCPADVTGDGTIGSQDLFDFLTLYSASHPDSDWNADGMFTSQDLFDFLTAYFNGCP